MRIQRFNARLLVFSVSETACLRDAHSAAADESKTDECDGDESERCGLRNLYREAQVVDHPVDMVVAVEGTAKRADRDPTLSLLDMARR